MLRSFRYLRIAFSAICVIATLLLVLNRWTHSASYLRGAEENSWSLWIDVLKGFNGTVYYMGSDEDYSYFRNDGLIAGRYKAKTSRIRLPRTFPLGESKPYSVTQEMVLHY